MWGTAAVSLREDAMITCALQLPGRSENFVIRTKFLGIHTALVLIR
jgi:hypothetical protein